MKDQLLEKIDKTEKEITQISGYVPEEIVNNLKNLCILAKAFTERGKYVNAKEVVNRASKYTRIFGNRYKPLKK